MFGLFCVLVIMIGLFVFVVSCIVLCMVLFGDRNGICYCVLLVSIVLYSVCMVVFIVLVLL